MTLKAGLSIAALLLSASGCGGSGNGTDTASPVIPAPVEPPSGFPPAPPPGGGGDVQLPNLAVTCDSEGDAGSEVRGGEKGGIWVGAPSAGTDERSRLLVAETSEFRMLPPDGWSEQTFGTFQVEGTNMYTTDSVWVKVQGLTWLETDAVPLDMFGALDEEAGLTLEFELPTTFPGPAPLVTYGFAACNALYQRDSSLATLAGTYLGGNTTLAIDDQGVIFYQRSSCVGSGTAELIDPDFNMYRMQIEVSSCSGNTVHAPGRLFSGLAYLSDSGDGDTNDVLEFALSSANAVSTIAWGHIGTR